jgi:hypothetical protein
MREAARAMGTAAKGSLLRRLCHIITDDSMSLDFVIVFLQSLFSREKAPGLLVCGIRPRHSVFERLLICLALDPYSFAGVRRFSLVLDGALICLEGKRDSRFSHGWERP